MGAIKLAVSGQQLGGFGKSLRKILSLLRNFSVSWVELWTFNLIGGFRENEGGSQRVQYRRSLCHQRRCLCERDG